METNNILLPLSQKINIIRKLLLEVSDPRNELIKLSEEYGIINLVSFQDFSVRLTITDVVTRESTTITLNMTPKYNQKRDQNKSPIYEYSDDLIENVIKLAYQLKYAPQKWGLYSIWIMQ